MTRMFCVAAVVAVLAGGCGTVRGPEDSGTTFARDALQKFVDSGEMPGAISVFYKDGVQETACLGYADVAEKRPVALDDVFMQCSQTKGFCGVSVAMLVEEGKLGLDDPVSKYLPEFAELWVRVSETNGVRTLRRATNVLTVRMCMNHSGGFGFDLPNAERMGGWSRRMPLRSVAATAASQPLLFEPGTRTRYSNVGIDIGAAVVEKVTGMRWERFLKERVLDPLEMKDTGFRPSDGQLAGRLGLYEVGRGKTAKGLAEPSWMQRPFNDDRVFPSAGAGLWTTAADQLKFYKMLMNLGLGENGVRILKEETVKSLLAVSTRQKGTVSTDWTSDGYSLGLCAPSVDNDDAWFGHGGAWGTNCMVNWHRRELRLWAVQFYGSPREWQDEWTQAAERFFQQKVGGASAAGRMK